MPKGVKPRKVDVERLKALWPSRLTDKELAARLGHSRGTVRRRAMQIGLQTRRSIWARAEA